MPYSACKRRMIMFQIIKEHKGFGKQIRLLAKNELIKKYKGGKKIRVEAPLGRIPVFYRKDGKNAALFREIAAL